MPRIRRRAKQRGVTLVELLIAITLVAALAVGMLMAIRSSLTTMERINVRLEQNRRVMGIQQIVSRQIGGAIPVTGGCRFTGAADSMRFVTSYSVNEGARGFPRVVVFSVARDPAGGVQLEEAEYPYTGSGAAGCAGDGPGALATPLVLANRLASCTIAYEDPQRFDSSLPGRWVQAWNNPLLPAGVRIDTQPLDGFTSNLPALAVNAKIHITRQNTVYVDLE